MATCDTERPRVAVCGAGVSGIAAAVCILEELPHCSLTVFSSLFSPHTTGDLSAGLWEPIYFGDTPAGDISRWSGDTWDVFARWHQEDPDGWGVRRMPGALLSDVPPDQFQYPEWGSFVDEYRVLTPGECRAYGDRYRSGFSYRTYMAEPAIFLPRLMEQIRQKGGVFVQKNVESLVEVAPSADVVVNCTGLGARLLAGDTGLVPARGQVVRVKAPAMKRFFIDDTKDNFHYILPNIDTVVLGGTCDVGEWSTTPHPATSSTILARCAASTPELEEAEVVAEKVGLRPYRGKGVRLGVEALQCGRRRVPVVHNYGHGGSGVTLMWGCGQQVAALVKGLVASGGSDCEVVADDGDDCEVVADGGDDCEVVADGATNEEVFKFGASKL